MPQPRVAFVTGASSGIGYATALAFARRGIHVIGTGRRTERLAQLESEAINLPDGHGEIRTLVADVRDAEAMCNAVEQAVQHFGRLDILVANAGVGHRGSIAEADWNDLETLLRTNIDGVLHSVRAAIPAMRAGGGGHIILISSVAYNLTAPYTAAYAASKAFVSSLARSLRLELEDDHIWVTDMRVGRTHTEFNQRRLGKPGRGVGFIPVMRAEQVAEAIVRASTQRRQTVTVRWLDQLIILGSTLAPGLVGRIARRQYR